MRLIDADALRQEIESEIYWGQISKDNVESLDEIDDAPTVDAVPVVRCKDCKYLTRLARGGYGYTLHCGYRGHLTYENDYCAAGRRRATNEAD